MELLSQLLYSENIFSTGIGRHLENSCHFEKKKVANRFFQTSILRGVPMPTFMLVSQTERFCLNIDLICRAIGKIQIRMPHQRKFVFLFFFQNKKLKKSILIHVLKICTQYVQMIHKGWTTIFYIHLCQTYLTVLPVLINNLFPLSCISDNLKFCNSSVNFEITRFNCNIFGACSKCERLDEFCRREKKNKRMKHVI
jgi:hypothetical protein